MGVNEDWWLNEDDDDNDNDADDTDDDDDTSGMAVGKKTNSFFTKEKDSRSPGGKRTNK